MIDVSREELIPIRLVPRRLPPRPSGRSVHVSAVYRWVQRGVRGVRLDAIRIGGTTYTSQEALQRFGTTSHAATFEPPPATVARAGQIARAARRLDEMLGKRKDLSPDVKGQRADELRGLVTVRDRRTNMAQRHCGPRPHKEIGHSG
jgi:Protein of unknown function (DUF1580)